MDEATIRQMYDLLHMNMAKIVPSTMTKEEGYACWRKAFDENLRNGTRHILYQRRNILHGYISYTVWESSNEIYWNEVQIHPRVKLRGACLRELLSRFLSEIADCRADTVRTYANNLNRVSQALLEKIGFKRKSASERGVRYTISKAELARRLGNLRRRHTQ